MLSTDRARLDRQRNVKLNFGNMHVENVDPTVPDCEAGQAEDGCRQHEAMDHSASARAEGVESRKRRDALGSGLWRRGNVPPEFRAERPLPNQRHQTIQEQLYRGRLSCALIEDGKHLVGKSLAKAGGMQTQHAAV